MSGLRSAIGVFLAAWFLQPSPAEAQAELTLLGIGQFSGENYLFDIELNTGRPSNPRSTGRTELLVGIALSPQGTLYSLSAFVGTQGTDSVFTIDPVTGATHVVGPTGLDGIYEGDLDFDPTTGLLYGLQQAGRQLFTIDPDTGAATTVGSIAKTGDFSAMAFDAGGTLYLLETTNGALLTVDPSDASVLSSVPLDGPEFDILAGMDFHRETGVLYVAAGVKDGGNMLWTADTTTGVLTTIGPTGLGPTVTGLEFIPEPATGLLLALGASLALCRRRKGL